MFYFIQIELILEFCSKGDLRSYLANHRLEFEKSLQYYCQRGVSEEIAVTNADEIPNDIRLLYRWTYQV